MRYSLKTKLSISYMLVAFLFIVIVSLLANKFFEKHFIEYVKQNQEQKNIEVVNTVTKYYKENQNLNSDAIEKIGVNALENGLIIKIKDNKGNIVWDANVHNDGKCQRIVEHMGKNVHSHYPNMEGKYEFKPYSLYHNNKKIGTVEIGSYEPFYLTDNDLEFIKTLNKLLLSVGVFSLFFALILGNYMANKISSPISRVIMSAKSITNGDYSNRVSEKSNTNEIKELTKTINDLAETLEKQDLLRKRMTADVAHELRTPMTTLRSHIEAMIDGIWQLDVERLKVCHEEIIRVNKLIGDLEELAKYESENLILHKTKFDVSELIKNIIKNFDGECVQKEIQIEFVGNEEKVFADKDKLSQVIINLISNSLKYTSKNGKVIINISGNESMSLINFKDSGIGIGENDLPYIFERFYRADKSRNRITGGSGIGLTITKAIVEAHCGKIEVFSQLGEGTEFIISIPK